MEGPVTPMLKVFHLGEEMEHQESRGWWEGKPMASWRGLGFPGPHVWSKKFGLEWTEKEFARKYDPVKKGRGAAGDMVAGREFLTGAQMASCSQVRASALSPALSVMLLKGTVSLREGDFHHSWCSLCLPFESPFSMYLQECRNMLLPRRSLGSSQQMKRTWEMRS